MVNLPAFDPAVPCCVRGEQPKGYSPTPCLSLANAGFNFEVFCADAQKPSRHIFADGQDTGEVRHRFFARITSPDGKENLSAFSTEIQNTFHEDYLKGVNGEWEPSLILDNLTITCENYHPNDENGNENEEAKAFRYRIITRSHGAALLTGAAKSALAVQ